MKETKKKEEETAIKKFNFQNLKTQSARKYANRKQEIKKIEEIVFKM